MKPRTKCLMWVRPSYRTYAYNLSMSWQHFSMSFDKFYYLDVGEQYYSPLADYVKRENIGRQNPPGLLCRKIIH